MTDIEKLLTEAGFREVSRVFHVWERDQPTWLCVRLTHHDTRFELFGYTPDLSAILLALQGKVALTEEERKVIEAAMEFLWEENCGDLCSHMDCRERRDWINTLDNLLARSTTQQHHQEGEKDG